MYACHCYSRLAKVSGACCMSAARIIWRLRRPHEIWIMGSEAWLQSCHNIIGCDNVPAARDFLGGAKADTSALQGR